MTALKMTVDEALALADQWCAGLTMDTDSKGWGAILLVLAEEVRRLRADVDTYMRIANEEANRSAALEADARRYRWLVAPPEDLDWFCDPYMTLLRWMRDGWETDRAEIDAAIDRAIAEMEATNAG